MTHGRPVERAPRGPAARPGFRPEIQGLRGLAILLVVAYHLWTSGRVSGGVDVFLFISAFLMTGSFVRKGTAFTLVDFLVQRFRRLVPMASIVVAATLVAGVTLQTPTRYPGLLTHAVASLLYRENWQLIAEATDYTAPNPLELNAFQHFWSLSVQGQLFVLLPLLFVGCALAERRFGVPIRRTLAVALGVLTVASFAYALHLVDAAPAAAYFSTWARAWEFTAAGLLATVPAWTPQRRLGAAMSWLGLGLLLVTGIVWGRGDFPGAAAVPPLAAAALIVFAGPSTSPWHAAWWLSLRPVTFVANRAYTLYLWHWPVYVYYLDVTETTNPRTGVVGSVVVIGLSFLLADVSTRLVERRFHGLAVLRKRAIALTAILAFSLIGASVIGGVAALVERDTRVTAGLPPEERPGARVLTPGATPPPTPSPSPSPGRNIAPPTRSSRRTGRCSSPPAWAASPTCPRTPSSAGARCTRRG
ncbi:acyltransferase [Propioniciclava coleopterorum]|uniref:Acyltransferase n=1 Tax=Propioniciclava coleopterorum TaxID=2714937 RepID=A0A6G7Y4U5_9ACTN|nr:acyltransferase [Propioniciclava coleopterorum]QIK71840.1 acyltransferase [Propioniciclava coleopterorum]